MKSKPKKPLVLPLLGGWFWLISQSDGHPPFKAIWDLPHSESLSMSSWNLMAPERWQNFGFQNFHTALSSLKLIQFDSASPIKNLLPGPDDQSLQEILEQKLSGWSRESPSLRASFELEAQRYVNYRESRLGSLARVKAYEDECQRPPKGDYGARAAFCLLAEDLALKKRLRLEQRAHAKKRPEKLNLSEAIDALEKGQLIRLLSYSAKSVRHAIRSIGSIEASNAIVKAILEKKDEVKLDFISEGQVSEAEVAVFLASKLEEFLPGSYILQQIKKLYARFPLNLDNEMSQRAHYRLALLSIWDQDPSTALKALNALIASKFQHDYRSRALYWKFKILEPSLSDSEKKELKRGFLEEYPLSVHALYLLENSGETPINLPPDSRMRFRSFAFSSDGEINSRLRSIEALIAIHQAAWATEGLERLLPQTETCEPEFRLYMSALSFWLRNQIGTFRILSSLFKGSTTSLSVASMQLYYPHQLVEALPFLEYDLDFDLMLSLIRQESAFQTRALSPAGAMGLMQLMPATARRMKRSLRKHDLYEPTINLQLGSQFFSGLLKEFDGDSELALAAYNAGSFRVHDWQKRYGSAQRKLFLDLIPFKETREYVASISRNYYWYLSLYGPQTPEQVQAKMKHHFKAFSESIQSLP